jgi:gluconate 5-dehydrogenase
MTPTVAELFDLTGQVALVTGATGHLGLAIARGLAEAGANVVVSSRRLVRAEDTAHSLATHHRSQRHYAVELDHMDESSLERGFAATLERAGQINVLVNNAHEHPNEDWTNIKRDTFNKQLVHATAYFELARLVRDGAVAANRSASVVMMASMYGLVGSYPEAYHELGPASSVAYHALKGGIVQMTRHLAVYWAKDRVRVNAVSPGPFPSPRVNPQLVDRLSRKTPMGRVGLPHELTGAIVYLASNASSFTTGQNIVVDGGWTAW